MKVATEAEFALSADAIPRNRVLANEDTLVISGADSRGMSLNPFVNATRVENAGRFDVAGDGSRGIDVLQGDENFILNANGFRVAGANTVGIALTGNRNTVMNGQDAAAFPNSDVLVTPDGYYVSDAASITGGTLVTTVSAFVDLADSTLGNIPVTGDLVVTGPGAIGIDVNGDGNRIANVPGFGRFLPRVPGPSAYASRVLATSFSIRAP